MAILGLIISLLFVPSLVRAGGGGYDEDDDMDCNCSCFGGSSEPEPWTVVPVHGPDDPIPAECTYFVQREVVRERIKPALPAPACPVCQTCPQGAQPILSQSAHALEDSMKPKTTQHMHPSMMAVEQKVVKKTKLIATVKVKKGWFLKRYVDKYAKKGADLEATKAGLRVYRRPLQRARDKTRERPDQER